MRAVQLHNIPCIVFYDFLAGDVIGIAEAHLGAGGKTEIFFGRIFPEIIAVDIDLTAERNAAAAEGGVFRVERLLKFLCFLTNSLNF